MNSSRLLFILLCMIQVIMLSGCFGSSATKIANEVQHRADAKYFLGISAELKGDIKEAVKLLQESLRLSTSIADSQGKAKTLINLARLYRFSLQEMSKARVSIDTALALLEPNSDLFSEAAQEKSLLELPSDSATAMAWGEKAVAAEKGVLLGRRLNLLGRIQIVRGETASAEITLQKALIENRRTEQKEEEANSLRMLGIIARAGKRVFDSEKLLSEAMEIDKRIGASSKVAIDLEELSATALVSGATDKAITLLQSAFEVNQSGGRPRKASANLIALADLYQSRGQLEDAGKARKKAEDLVKSLK